MATDVDVQYFSHINGLTLGNNWGDLIRLLDKALVTGVDFTQITAASIDAQGDVHITLYAAHNAMLFQVVELSGFAPASLNQKYRIKGVPSTTELILKPHTAITETSITTVGAGKLASLGYDIIFRDTNDVKRVYRAKNPTAQHPFIRVDESLTSPDGTTGAYTSTYAKYAMVGLLEHMEHINDYENPNVLQLPFDSTNPAKNWKITGTGTSVVRGWSRWYWAMYDSLPSTVADTVAPAEGARNFSLVGDKDCFYLLNAFSSKSSAAKINKQLKGCGLANASLGSDFTPPWVLLSPLTELNASSPVYFHSNVNGGTPLTNSAQTETFFTTKYNELAVVSAHSIAKPIVPDRLSGNSNLYSGSNLAPLEIPFFDAEKLLRGSLKHILYAGKVIDAESTTPMLGDTSMYISDGCYSRGGFYFYLGELE